MGRFGLDGEIDQLKRDKQVLMSELVKLRQQQQNSRTYLQEMEQRLKKTESKQRQMMNFLARAMHNPGLLRQLVQRSDKRKEIEDAFAKKRRRTIDKGPSSDVNCRDIHDSFEVEEVETVDMDIKEASDGRMKGLNEDQKCKVEEQQEGIWEDFWNGRFEGEVGSLDNVFEDVNVLVDGLDYTDAY